MLVEKKMICAECHSSFMTDQKNHTFITIMIREWQKSCSKILKQYKKQVIIYSYMQIPTQSKSFTKKIRLNLPIIQEAMV